MVQEIAEFNRIPVTWKEFLQEIKAFWLKYKLYLEWYKKILLYINRFYAKNNGTSVIKEGLEIFKRITRNKY